MNFVSKLALTAAMFAVPTLVGAQDNNQTQETTQQPALVVPVYPQGAERPEGPATVLDLRDSYIVLSDGAVTSVADWVLGAIARSNPGAGMGDFETRQFLGQVARALIGEDEQMVDRSPTLTKTPGAAIGNAFAGMNWAEIAEALQHDQSLVKSVPAERGIVSFSPGHATEGSGDVLMGRVILREDIFQSRLQQIQSDLGSSPQ